MFLPECRGRRRGRVWPEPAAGRNGGRDAAAGPPPRTVAAAGRLCYFSAVAAGRRGREAASDGTLELGGLIEDIFGPDSVWTGARRESLEGLRRAYRARGEVRNGSAQAKDARRKANQLMTELAGMPGRRGKGPKAEIVRRTSGLVRAAERAPEEMRKFLKEMMLVTKLGDPGGGIGL